MTHQLSVVLDTHTQMVPTENTTDEEKKKKEN